MPTEDRLIDHPNLDKPIWIAVNVAPIEVQEKIKQRKHEYRKKRARVEGRLHPTGV